jgi:hypothetical protein
MFVQSYANEQNRMRVSGFRDEKNILRSSGIPCSVEWQFRTDVSRQPIGPIFILLGPFDRWSWDR